MRFVNLVLLSLIIISFFVSLKQNKTRDLSEIQEDIYYDSEKREYHFVLDFPGFIGEPVSCFNIQGEKSQNKFFVLYRLIIGV